MSPVQCVERDVGLLGEDAPAGQVRLVPDRLHDHDARIADAADQLQRPVVGPPDVHHHLVDEGEDRPDRLGEGIAEPDGVAGEGEARDLQRRLRGPSRRRRSVVEWSFGSPATAARPPYRATSAASGMVSGV